MWRDSNIRIHSTTAKVSTIVKVHHTPTQLPNIYPNRQGFDEAELSSVV